MWWFNRYEAKKTLLTLWFVKCESVQHQKENEKRENKTNRLAHKQSLIHETVLIKLIRHSSHLQRKKNVT